MSPYDLPCPIIIVDRHVEGISLCGANDHRLWIQGALATAGVAFVCHWLAHPIPGFGIAVPLFVPAAAAAFVARALSRTNAAPLAYISGSLGTLIGADLLHVEKIQGLGAPVASIGLCFVWPSPHAPRIAPPTKYVLVPPDGKVRR
jgi:uncharacterized membrane protein